MIKFTRNYSNVLVFPAAMMVLSAALTIAGYSIGILEFLGVILSLSGMAMVKRQIAFGYLPLTVSQIILGIHFINNNAWGALGFAIIGTIISITGYINWTRPRKDKGAPELRPSFLNNWWLAPIFAGAAAIMGYRWGSGLIGEIEYLAPYFSLIGQVLLINKRVQGWMFFTLSITVMAILMYSIEAYLLLGRNLMYMIIGTTAVIKWTREIKTAKTSL